MQRWSGEEARAVEERDLGFGGEGIWETGCHGVGALLWVVCLYLYLIEWV